MDRRIFLKSCILGAGKLFCVTALSSAFPSIMQAAGFDYFVSAGCIGCGQCAAACSVNAIRIENGKAVINQDLCRHCGTCFNICPRQSIKRG